MSSRCSWIGRTKRWLEPSRIGRAMLPRPMICSLSDSVFDLDSMLFRVCGLPFAFIDGKPLTANAKRMIYCISGLGADKRVIQYLRLDGLPLQHIHWVRPNRDESITRYTERLLEQIDLTDEVV